MTGATLVTAERMVTPSGVMEDGAVLVEGEKIAAVDRADRIAVPGGVRLIECQVLMPGFVDMHVHGGAGYGFGEGSEAARDIARSMASAGVTTCYAGLGAGATLATIARTVAAAAEAVGIETGGARIAGIFMEGPFINPARKGAWNAAHLRTPSIAELDELVAASQGRIRRVNVAPELPGALDFTRAARDQGIVVSLGHSNATCEEALAGIDAGATITNHTYNAMSPLDHRAPGLVGATLARDELLGELILDFVHVHPLAVATLVRAKGTKGVALITDGSALVGMPEGVYETGGRTLTVKDGSCRLPDGTLAGSVATFDQCVRNAATLPGIDLPGLASLSSGNAARAMGTGTETGGIARWSSTATCSISCRSWRSLRARSPSSTASPGET